MKSKSWSIAAIVLGAVCFILGLVGFFVAAIGGKVDISTVAVENYVLCLIGLVLGIVCVICASKRTEWKPGMIDGFSSLAKIGMMLNIIVLAATLMNT